LRFTAGPREVPPPHDRDRGTPVNDLDFVWFAGVARNEPIYFFGAFLAKPSSVRPSGQSGPVAPNAAVMYAATDIRAPRKTA
jgi:hypothetical protein